MRRFLRSPHLRLAALLLTLTLSAEADTPPRARGLAAQTLRVMGPGVSEWLAPSSGAPSMLVKLPPNTNASALGLDVVAPGIGRLRGARERLLTFADEHPELSLEVAPPLRLLNDRARELVRAREANQAGLTGKGTFVAIADTGIDVTHADFRDDQGRSRVRWVLDFSQPPAGLHPAIEARFAVDVESTQQRFGAVFSNEDIDAKLAEGSALTTDNIGHGTHVAGTAAGDGGDPDTRSPYIGMAPGAELIVVRLTRGAGQSIENDDLVRAMSFIFDRADAEGRPCVANVSLGSDFGPHDGSSLWEAALASNVGPDKPGHVIVVAAGNSGSAATQPIHQSVHVDASGETVVPIEVKKGSGSVNVWINFRNADSMRVGMRGPDGEWIPLLGDGEARGRNRGEGGESYNAGVIVGASANNSPIRPGSSAAIVALQGMAFPIGRYAVVLAGEGDAELYLQSSDGAGGAAGEFLAGVREGTVNLPAAHPTFLAVGATVNRESWTSKNGQPIGVRSPVFDQAGDFALTDQFQNLQEGEVAFFSSAGPNALGLPKPEITAPGAVIASTLSRDAGPNSPSSIFHGARCPRDRRANLIDSMCMLVDDQHAVTSGTSMAAPVVTGAVALLLERDPTLTQAEAIAVVQAGAHPHRGPARYFAQAGPGELDVAGSLAALARLRDPIAATPVKGASWIALGNDYWDADGRTEMVALLELRNERGEPADLFDSSRLAAVVSLEGEPLAAQPNIERVAPGLFRYRALAPKGSGGKRATFGASFDGASIVTPKTLPVAADGWRAKYPTRLGGGCAVHGSAADAWLLGLAAMLVLRRRAWRSPPTT